MGKDKDKDKDKKDTIVSLTGGGGRGHKQRGAGTVITAKAPIVTNDGIVLKAHERLPVQLLSEYCQKEKRPMPKYIPQHPSYRYKVILEDSKNSKNDLEFLPNQSVESDKVARDYAALLALWHFQKNLPLERKIPEPYSTSWIQMLNAEKEEKNNKAGIKDTKTVKDIKSTKEKVSNTIQIPSNVTINTNDETNTIIVPTLDEATADWLCEKCGNQNFATLASGMRRDKCFKCQAKKSESCVLVASTNHANSNNSTLKSGSKKPETEKVSVSNNTKDLNNNVLIMKRKVPPAAVLNLKSVETFASKAEEEKHNQEKLMNRRKKSSFFEALIKANRPSPIYLSPKMKNLLEIALGLSSNDIAKSSHENLDIPELSDMINDINDLGILTEEFNDSKSIQSSAVTDTVIMLQNQGFSDSSISQTLFAIQKSPEMVIDELDQEQPVTTVLLASILQKVCLECICLNTDDTLLPQAFGAKMNEGKRKFVVFNPKGNSNKVSANTDSLLINSGWNEEDINIATNIIKNGYSKCTSNIYMIGFLLAQVTYQLIDESSSSSLFPSSFVNYLLGRGSNGELSIYGDHVQEDLIQSEIEMLKEMYDDRFRYAQIEYEGSSYIHHLSLTIPAINGLANKSYGKLDIFIPTMINYPDEVPLILLNLKSDQVGPDLLLYIQYLLWRKALECVGDVMVFQISSFIELELGAFLSSASPIPLTLSTSLRQLQDNPNLESAMSSIKVVEEDELSTFSEGKTTTATFSDTLSEVSSTIQIKKIKANHPFWTRIKNDTMQPSFIKNAGPYQKVLEKRKKLPSYNERENFLSLLKDNRCIVVTGETGCGKTTQCPTFIFEENPKAKIIVCQPRRLAAVSVASRVAEELACDVGEDVGYMVKGDSKATNSTRIVFCTYGVLLRRLQDDPDLKAIDYVVLDEIHERGIDSDFTLALLMSALSRRNNLKIILMSATISTEKFANYLGKSLNIPPSPILFIRGQTFPVAQFYKKEFEEIVRSRPLLKQTYYDDDNDESEEFVIGGKQRKGDIDYDLMVRLICCLAEGHGVEGGMLEKAQGTILVFMPGVGEIGKLIRLLITTFHESDSSCPNIIPLHANLSPQEQKKVFEASSKLKIVVATNVAEASVTIVDVTVVIDSCRVKEMDFDSERQTSALIMKMASQDSMRQRKGRAGRVQKGRCFRIINQNTFEKLPTNTVPEMLRSPLDNLILQVKAMDLQENCVELLSRCPDPPNLSAIDAAIENLMKIQALDKNQGLTALGRHISYLPCEPCIGKLLIYGSLLGSLYHASSIAAIITNRSPFQNFSSDDMKPFEEFARKSFDGNIISDYTVMASTLLTFNESKNKKSFCKNSGLSFERLKEISESQRDFLDSLVSVGFINSISDGLNIDSQYNKNCKSARIVSSFMCAGLYPKVCKILRPPKRFVETIGGNLEKSVEAIELKFYLPEKNEESNNKSAISEKFKQKNIDIATDEMTRVFVHPSSICFKNNAYNSSNYVLYGEKQLSFNLQKESKIYLRNVSEMGPYALLLFGGKLEAQYLDGTITVDNWIRFSAPGRIVALIQLLRKRLDELLEEKIVDPSVNIFDSKVLEAACSLLTTDGLG